KKTSRWLTSQGGTSYEWSFSVPSSWRNGKIQKATVYAMNVDSNGRQTGPNRVISEKSWVCDSSGKDLKPQMDKFFHSILHDCSRQENFVSDRCAKERAAVVKH